MSEQVSQDFVFGTLATDELRLAQDRATKSGVAHGHSLEPPDPRPGELVTVHVTLSPWGRWSPGRTSPATTRPTVWWP